MNLTLSFYTTLRFMRMGFENILDERVQIDSTQLVDGYLMCVEKTFLTGQLSSYWFFFDKDVCIFIGILQIYLSNISKCILLLFYNLVVT